MNVLDYLDTLHPQASWRPWRAFCAAVYGEPMSEADLELFRRCTGRERPREGGYPEAVCVCGVQSGKSSVCGALAGHAALTGDHGTHALLVGQDHRGAMRALLRYAREPFETVDAFRAEVDRQTRDTLELKGGTYLSAYPCRPAAVRGVRANIVAIDELAFFTATDGRPTDTEMLRVARGRVATTGGKVIVLSSPYWQVGALWDLYRKHYAQEDSDTLVWQADAPTMNPTLAADYLERMRLEDPEAAQSEVEGLFRAGVSVLFDPDALDAVVETDVREHLPVAGVRYAAHFDPSGGRRDAAALAVAHLDGDRAVLDLCRAWPSPHNPAQVIADAVEELKRFGVQGVQVDRFGGEYPREQFRDRGVKVTVAEKSTSEHYLELLPLVNAAGVTLLDDDALKRELLGLERRRGSAGRDRVDHRRGSNDDRAAASTGALLLAAAGKAREWRERWLKPWSAEHDALDRLSATVFGSAYVRGGHHVARERR